MAVKIIFLNRFFYPDHSATSRILSDIAFGLAKSGMRVLVITSRLRYDAPRNPLPAEETVGGVEIHRVWTSSFGRLHLFGRTVDYLTFYVSAGWTLWRLARTGDVVVAKTDPPMLSVIAAPVARMRGAKSVNWLQDVFPEVARALGVGRGLVPQLAHAILHRLRDRSLKNASMNVAIGERMASTLTDLGVHPDRLCVIANFADGTLISPVPRQTNELLTTWGLNSNFVVGYSGNFGRAHEYRTLFGAMEELSGSLQETDKQAAPRAPEGTLQSISISDDENVSASLIAWLIVGGGALYGQLKRDVVRRQIRNVRFEPYQPDDRLSDSLSAADVHIVSLRPELEGLIVPSKFYGIAAAGRPTIFVGDPDGEIARHIARHDCGCTIEVGDVPSLARAIRDLASDPQKCRATGERARRAFESEFDKAIAIQQWKKLLEEIALRPTGAHFEPRAKSPLPPENSLS